MRLIDADKLFDKFLEMWGTEVEAEIASMFMQTVNDAPTIDPPPNNPLTLEKLREMDGEPVWTKCLYDENRSGWTLVDSDGDTYNEQFSFYDYGYGDTWLAYRRRPEEETA